MIIRGVVPQYYDYRVTEKGKKKVKVAFRFLKSIPSDLTLKKTDFLSLECIHPRPIWYVDNEELAKNISQGTIFIKPETPNYVLAISIRTQQIIQLLLFLRAQNIRADYLAGAGKRAYDPEAQVLVSQDKKAGVGFNDPKFDTIYYTSDITKIKQPFGRIRQDGGTHVDIVDENSTIQRHFKARKAYYKSLGASIRESTIE